MPYPDARTATSLTLSSFSAGHADRVAVVLDHEHERQLVDRREVERLVDVALVRAPLAHHRDGDLAGVADLRRQRDPDRVEDLGRDRRRDRHQVVLGVAVVAGHLAAARGRVAGRRVLRGHDVARAHPEGEARGDRAVEGRDPVVALLQRPGQPDLGALVALAADHERDAAGAVEDPHPLVDRPRERDRAVHGDEVGVGEADRGGERARRGVPAPIRDRHRVLREPVRDRASAAAAARQARS